MEGNSSSIENQIDQHLPFVLYCKPNSAIVCGLLQQNDTLYDVNDFTESGFVFASFDGKLTHLIPEANSERVVLDRKSFSKAAIDCTSFTSDLRSKVVFENLVASGIKAIKENQMKKVVLSRRETVAVTDFDLLTTFQKLIALYPTAFVYCYYHPKVGTWLGATPEQLVKSTDSEFETIALAGTQKDQGSSEVIWQKKEQEEQQFVTDYIVAKLNNKVSGLKVSSPYSVKAGMIWHIKSNITAVFNERTKLKEIVQLLHPTPAVCGFPKEESKAFILNQEQYDRKYYTGFLGELNQKGINGTLSSDLFVNLRSMEIEGNKANIYIGCGITKDSDPTKEWEESVNKSLTMKRVL
ncbi:MAG: isochorismate synthase [Flavobacteriaceae bacterium]|nr:isochorismate synthase [Flavobacteriaceae bacterium]